MADAETTTTDSGFSVWSIIQWAVYILFYGVVLASLPFIFSKWVYAALMGGSGLFFYGLAGPLLERWVNSPSSPWRNAGVEGKKEAHNRLVSLMFNLSTGLPSYAAYFSAVSLLPTFTMLLDGRTDMMDFFTAWVLGYFLYDFPTLGATFGRGATIIQLHHCAEAIIMWSYCANMRIGSLYVIGGGLMQLSSGMLHVQRLRSLTQPRRKMENGQAGSPKVSPQASPQMSGREGQRDTFAALWKWPLALAWLHARMIVFPSLQWMGLTLLPLDIFHACLLVAGIALTAMNGLWLVKIVRMKSLSF